MSLRVQDNASAVGAQNTLSHATREVERSLARLSSGYRINSAADDAAGLSISEKMRGQISGLNAAQNNIADGIGLVQTTEAMLGEVHGMLGRIREFAVAYKNGTQSATERAAIQTEVNALASEIERIGATARFNGISLLTWTTPVLTLQIGAGDGEIIVLPMISLGNQLQGAYYSLTVAGATDIAEIDAAIVLVSRERSRLGMHQNRLERIFNAHVTYAENLTAAESQIRDADVAADLVTLTKNRVIQQSAQAMLSQAAQSSQSVLQLLG